MVRKGVGLGGDGGKTEESEIDYRGGIFIRQYGNKIEETVVENTDNVIKPHTYNRKYSHVRRPDHIEGSGAYAPSAAAARRKRYLKRCQGQEVEVEVDSTESGVMDVEELKEVVSKLSTHDKIVHISFDELFISKRMIYSRAEDKMPGCGLSPKGQVAEYISVLEFAVRSLLTQFNILLSAISITSHKDDPNEVENVLKLAEEIGLDGRAVVCARSLSNKRRIKLFFKGVYKQKQADGSVKKILLLYDYIRYDTANIPKKKTLDGKAFKYNLQSELSNRNRPKDDFWRRRNVVQTVSCARNAAENVHFCSDITPTSLEAAIDAGIFNARRGRQHCRAYTKFMSDANKYSKGVPPSFNNYRNLGTPKRKT
uniref:Uncharacterized protein n=1 Tax=Glossina austeni TaxID=7395 RepID=A0A1A9V6I5_GLOAU